MLGKGLIRSKNRMKLKYGIDGPLVNNLVLLVDQMNGYCEGDTQNWYDLSGVFRGDGIGHDLEQTTAANQPSIGTDPAHRDFDGNDYVALKKIDDETGMTLMPDAALCDLTDANGTCVLPASTAYEGSGTASYRVVLKAAGTLVAAGYAGPVDGAIAYGSELITASDDRDFTVWGNVNWVAQGGAVIADGTGKMEVTKDATNAGVELGGANIGAATGLRAYRIQADVWKGTTTATAFVIKISPSVSSSFTMSFTLPATQQTTTKHFVLANSGDDINKIEIYTNVGDNGKTYYVDNVSVKPLTAFGTDAVGIYKEPSLTTRGWTSTGAGNVNSTDSLEIYKVLGDTTSDWTYECVLMPDDGQPAASQCIFAKADHTVPVYGFSVFLETTGKLEVFVSSDGATATGKITDAAVFTNGAQSKPKHLVISYDASGQTLTFYVNGTASASSNLGAGGPPSSVYDNYLPLTIGAASEGSNYFDGKKYMEALYLKAVTAQQAQALYNAIKGRFGI